MGWLRASSIVSAATLASRLLGFVRDVLLASGRVRVALTRDRDEFLVLQERYAIARRLGASLPLSRYTLTAPDPQKWRRHEAAIEAHRPLWEPAAARAEALLRR